jgi:hypothetical protein
VTTATEVALSKTSTEPSGHLNRQPGPAVQRFDFLFAPAYRRLALIFGVTPNTAWVRVSHETLEAHFGPWRVTTPLRNIAGIEVTGPYAFIKTAGPARLAVTDRGLTFATNRKRGVLIRFRDSVTGLEPLGVLRHPELTVTVADVDRLASLLRSHVDGADAVA